MSIIGKTRLAALLFGVQTLFAASSMQIQLLNYDGEELAGVVVGVPFLMHVMVEGDADTSNIEFSKNIEVCKLSSLGVVKSVTNLNGVINRSIVHKYLVRIDQPGTYVLGPIKAWQANQLLGSCDLSITVIDNVITGSVSSYPAVELDIAPRRAIYVGEELNVCVRFYFKDKHVSVPKLNLPLDIQHNFDVELSKGPVHGSNDSNGETRHYFEWQLVAIAKTPGSQIWPAVSVSFEKINRQNTVFIFHNYEKVELFSNAVPLQIKNLPPTNQKIDGVGLFTSFFATIDQANIKENQGAQLCLNLVGHGNFAKIKIPLLNVPSNLLAHESKSWQSDNQKSFEFVLQGVKKGQCSVPSQQFVYFDVAAECYKTLHSNAIEVNVLSVLEQSNVQLQEHAAVTQEKLLDQRIKPIFEMGQVQCRPSYYLPKWLFISIGLIPILLWSIIFSFNYYRNRKTTKIALLRSRLQELEVQADSALLYSFFNQIFIQLFHLPSSQINIETIMALLSMYDVSERDKLEFSQFFYAMQGAAFGNEPVIDLFKKAQNWLAFLEQLLAA